MQHDLRKTMTILVLFVFGTLSITVQNLRAEDHLVTPADLHSAIIKTAEARQNNLAKLQNFLSSVPAREALKTSKIDLAKVEKAIPHLNDEELARLASQAEKIQSDLAAGALSNKQIYTLALVGLVGLVVVLLAAT